MTEQAFTGALVDRARQEDRRLLAHLRRPDGPGKVSTHAAWHVWVEDALYVVSGGTEQPLPGLAQVDRVEVTMRSKENGGRLVTWVADASAVLPDDERWEPRHRRPRLRPAQRPGPRHRRGGLGRDQPGDPAVFSSLHINDKFLDMTLTY